MSKSTLKIIGLVVFIWFVGFYNLGPKPLAGHFYEIYQTPLVQSKLHDLSKGIGKTFDRSASSVKKLYKDKISTRFFDEKKATSHQQEANISDVKKETTKDLRSLAQQSNDNKSGIPPFVETQPIKAKKPMKDILTENDRAELNKLVADKLQQYQQ